MNVGRPLDEGERDVIHLHGERELQVFAVFLCQRRNRQAAVRDVDALTIGQRAHRIGPCDQRIAIPACHRHL